MEKLSVHNLNKPSFCSLSILNTLPVSSMLQLAATQHLLVAAGYVSKTWIEQQKSSSFKQTTLANRSDHCKHCQDCSRLELHCFMAGNGIFQWIFQWILLEQLYVLQEVLLVLPSNLAFQVWVSIQACVTALQEAGALLCQTSCGCTGKEGHTHCIPWEP